MLRRVQPLLLCMLLLAGRAALAQNPNADRAALTERFLTLEVEEGSRYQPIKELVDIDPEVGFDALKESWTRIRSNDVKLSLINTFLAAANPHMVGVIHLGATDPSLVVQNFALTAAESIGFVGLSEDYNAYLEWHQANESKTIQTILNEGVKAFVGRFKNADETQKNALLAQLLSKNFSAQTKISRARRRAVTEAGIFTVLAKCVGPDADPNVEQMSFQFLRMLKPDEAFMKRTILPLASKATALNTRTQALSLLGSPDNNWATEPLLKMLTDEYPDQIAYTIGQAIASIGDARAIPTLIAMLDGDNTREGMMMIGGFLAGITGVFVQDGHDAVWWHAWWDKNKKRLPPDVQAMPIPKLALKKRVQENNGGVQVQAFRSELRQAAGDPQRSYWLITPSGIRLVRNGGFGQADRFGGGGRRFQINVGLEANGLRPQRGGEKLGLLVVLSGGDGNGANMVPFWTEVVQSALKGRYMVALPVAPRFTAEQTVPWVTEMGRKQIKGAKFTVETFAADIVKDVAQAYNVDNTRIFLHGVMESGPAAYACSLEINTPFRGFYLLAAPFKSAQLPPLKTAKGHRYFIQHSKDDKGTPFLMAAAAQKILTEQGAVVKLAPYRGKAGYNFEDGMAKELSAAITWLEEGK